MEVALTINGVNYLRYFCESGREQILKFSRVLSERHRHICNVMYAVFERLASASFAGGISYNG